MKVLVVPSWYPPNGGRFFKLQSESLAKMGHQVDVLILEEKGITQKVNSKIDSSNSSLVNEIRNSYYRIPKLNDLNIDLFIKKYKKLFSQYLEKNTPDIIHVHSSIWAGVVVAEISIQRNIPYVITEHRSLFLEKKLAFKSCHIDQIKFALDHANSLLAVSSLMKTSISKYTPNAVSILPNMLDINFFIPQKKKLRAEFVFVAVGNLIAVKGFDILLEAFAKLTQNKNNVKLKIVGKGEALEYLLTLSKSLRIEKNVDFCGYMSKEELLEEYNNSDVFVSSSRIETFGLSIIEAMSCGLPVVATKSGGPNDIINIENGYLAEVENASSLQSKMQLMIENISNFDSDKIRKNVIANYSEKVVSEKLENQLKLCLKNKKQ